MKVNVDITLRDNGCFDMQCNGDRFYLGHLESVDEVLDELRTVLSEKTIEMNTEPPPERILWDAYVAMRERSPKAIRAKGLTDGNRRVIRAALKDGTVEEWLRGIDALLLSPHHNGQNDRDKLYLEPRHLFTKCTHSTVREHLDWLLDLADDPPTPVAVTSGLSGFKESRAKQQVLQAFHMPGSDEAQRLGEAGESYLRTIGIDVRRTSSETAPVFVRSIPREDAS